MLVYDSRCFYCALCIIVVTYIPLLIITISFQVRLPNGSVLRHSFSSESTLNDVCKLIADTYPSLADIQLVQVSFII